MAVDSYYPVSYGGVAIEAASITRETSYAYGKDSPLDASHSVGAIKRTEVFTVKGRVTDAAGTAGQLAKLEKPGQSFTCSIGGSGNILRTASDDVEGGPKPVLVVDRQVGQKYTEITLRITVVMNVVNGFSSDVVQIEINRNHSISIGGLSTVTTDGFIIVADGTCADVFREAIVKDYIGKQPDGDMIRGPQVFKLTDNKMRLSFSVRDSESFYPPAKNVVQDSFFKLTTNFDGIWLKKNVTLTIVPKKTPRGLVAAETFGQAALKELLYDGLEKITDMHTGATSELDSRTGNIIITAGIKFVSAGKDKDNQKTNPTAKGISERLFFGLKTLWQLQQFISGKRDGIPRGFAKIGLCKKLEFKKIDLPTKPKIPSVERVFTLIYFDVVEDNKKSSQGGKASGSFPAKTATKTINITWKYTMPITEKEADKILDYVAGKGQTTAESVLNGITFKIGTSWLQVREGKVVWVGNIVGATATPAVIFKKINEVKILLEKALNKKFK